MRKNYGDFILKIINLSVKNKNSHYVNNAKYIDIIQINNDDVNSLFMCN